MLQPSECSEAVSSLSI